MHTADFFINKLHLREHPEGGFYRELYRSDESVKKESLPGRYDDDRAFFTSIYFLLKSGQISRFHRLKSDEIWYFHTGSPLWIHILTQDGTYNKIPFGVTRKDHVTFQYTIPKGTWFGATVQEPDTFSLVSCSVSPGFDFNDFELADKEALLEAYPDCSLIINQLTI